MSKSPFWPEDTSVPPSVAHSRGMNHFGTSAYPSGLVPWTAARAPDLECGHNMYTTGRLRSCGYCGSMHPADLVAAIKAGAVVYWADFKYGWPHKVYVDNIPNPYAGMPNSTTSTGYGSKLGEQDAHTKDYITRVGGEWRQLESSMDHQKMPEYRSYPWHRVGEEAKTTHGKFYTEHLKDATPEEREIIERAMRYTFTFHEDGRVSWARIASTTGSGS